MPKIAGETAARIQHELNHASPALARARAGDLLVALIAYCVASLADITGMRTRLNSSLLSSGALTIKAGGSAVVKTGAAFAAVIGGALIRKAANTDMAALAGTLATAKSAAWAFYVDAAGNLTASAKTADAATHDAALASLAAAPDNLATIGYVVIDNATGANFVGGTTPLDTGSLTVTYYNTVGPVPQFAALTAATVGALGSR